MSRRFRFEGSGGTSGRWAILRRILGFTALVAALASPSVAQTTMLAYESQPGDSIGLGNSASYTPANATFTTEQVEGGLKIKLEIGLSQASLFLAAPGGAILVPGVYEGAVRYPFHGASKPGLSFSDHSHGCNKLTGRFTVYEAVYAAGGGVQSLAADFEQHCEGRIPALFGSIRLNSSIPRSFLVSVSDASAFEGDDLTRYAIFTVALSQINLNGVSVSYATADSTAIAGADYLPVSGSLVFPPGKTSQAIAVPLKPDQTLETTKRFHFSLQNAVGAGIGFGQVTGTVLDDDGPRTLIRMDSQPDDYIGRGELKELTPLDGGVTASHVGNGLTVSFNGEVPWTLVFEPPTSTLLLPGIYEGAQRFADEGSAGLQVYGDGRGCNTVSGRIVVHEAEFENDGSVRSFAADFEHFCDNSPTPLLGAVRINSARPVSDFSPWRRGASRLSAGWYHTCMVTNAGGVRCWGNNLDGQLGDGSTVSTTAAVDVAGLSSGVASVAAGGYHSCALTMTGGVKCWGYNGYGELGNGTTASASMPVDVIGLSTGVIGISAGLYHTCATTVIGDVKCWGNNLDGQLGDGTSTQREQPVDVTGLLTPMAGVSAGGYHTCASALGGGLRCWGYNGTGQLGDGTITGRPTPVDVSYQTDRVTSVSSGAGHTVASTTRFGTGKSWGNNGNGQLGNGSLNTSSIAGDIRGLGASMLGVAAGRFHTCALGYGGWVACWGSNLNGKVGDGTTTQRMSPVDVVGLGSGAIGVGAGAQHSCALTLDGAVKCWGDNSLGQLGDGTTTSRPTPVFVAGLSRLSVGDSSIVEGSQGKSILSFAVSLSAPSSMDVTVAFDTNPGTATAAVDYVAASGVLTIPAGSISKNVTVLVQGDTTLEQDETLTLVLSNPGGADIERGTGIGAILNDDPPSVAFPITQYRLYHAGTQEHLYTTDQNEYNVLGGAGWMQEGVAYKMLTNGLYVGAAAVPLFRLYHPGIQQHHWTTDSNEATTLSGTASWFYEGTIGYLLPTPVGASVPLYRLALANPALHLWTTDLNEYNTLATRGWVKEGIIGYVLP